ncbi:DUF6745 domain-containing protein [Actinoplanes sp. NPDC051494]|uniref:DUF6745 domain-containing protein n=1 Tax=Actinoplanes sp. NPDC051494 TaxID=3363907 RepID=UPI0037B9A394
MTAPVRPRAVQPKAVRSRSAEAVLDHWYQAADLRREWLDVGLSTEPADRDAAVAVVSRLYARHGRARPAFVWADSPRQALDRVTGVPGHDGMQRWLRPVEPEGRPPVAVDIAAGWSGMMAGLDDAADHPDLAAPRVPKGRRVTVEGQLPPVTALERGVPLRTVLRQGVREALWTALVASVAVPVRAALGPPSTLPVCWYGQQDASWIAYYDVLRRLGLTGYSPQQAARLDDWALLARSAGWWWPGDQVCVLVERPARIGPVSLPDAGVPVPSSPAVGYRDGWSIR